MQSTNRLFLHRAPRLASGAARRAAACAAIVLLALAAVPAHATFHLAKVNEVLLASAAGDPAVQFVELIDRGGATEAFTPAFAPYRLAVYDAAGMRVGMHALSADGLRAAAGTGRPYLISTPAADAAFAVTGDERLDVALPATAGQACFEARADPPAFSCLTWGAISRRVPTNSQGTGSASGPAPAHGVSDQRQADDSVIAAEPTPKAPNRTAAAPGIPRPAPAMPFSGVAVVGRRAPVDRGGRARLRLRCPAAATGSCRGTVTLLRAGSARVLGRGAFTLPASRSARIAVALSRAARRELRRRDRLAVRVRVMARDRAGRRRSTSARLTLIGATGRGG